MNLSRNGAREVRARLAALASPAKAEGAARFFKTGKRQYAEGDVFLGVTVPQQRAIARAHRALSHPDLSRLLRSEIHEERLTALLILVAQYESGDDARKETCVAFYLAHLPHINNWDLVDSSAAPILGAHLLTRDRAILRRLARSKTLWERRVAIVATHAFLRAGETKDAIAIAEALLGDEHDLIHKAVGWTLRELGKRADLAALRRFLDEHGARMPRTALRYAIERLPLDERKRRLAR